MQQSGNPEKAYSEGIFQQFSFLRKNGRFLITTVSIFTIFYYTSLYSFLLFHVLIDIFSVIAALSIYGFVKNHGAWIAVDSESSRGTTVRIFRPVKGGNSREDEGVRSI